VADNVITLPQLGKTYLNGPNRTPDATATTSKAIEGIVKLFKNVNYNSTAGAQVKDTLGAGEVTAILVRNASTVALLPGRVVAWKTLSQGKQVDGYVAADFGKAAGVVDPFLPSTGVAVNDYFWLIVKGPCLVKKSLDANTLASDDYVVTITAAASTSTTGGRIVTPALANNATSNASIALNRLGIAMSSSATTGADILVRLDLY